MNNGFSHIYQYFGPGVIEKDANDKEEINKCFVCENNDKKGIDGSFKTVRPPKGVTSNLIRHLETKGHEKHFLEYSKIKQTETSKKRKLNEMSDSPVNTPNKNSTTFLIKKSNWNQIQLRIEIFINLMIPIPIPIRGSKILRIPIPIPIRELELQL